MKSNVLLIEWNIVLQIFEKNICKYCNFCLNVI